MKRKVALAAVALFSAVGLLAAESALAAGCYRTFRAC